MVTMKKMDLFWLHANCPAKFKMLVLDAVIRSKVLYGLESAHLYDADLRNLETFQLKGLRKLLGLKTTYVNRESTNALIYKEANKKMSEIERKGRKKHSDI